LFSLTVNWLTASQSLFWGSSKSTARACRPADGAVRGAVLDRHAIHEQAVDGAIACFERGSFGTRQFAEGVVDGFWRKGGVEPSEGVKQPLHEHDLSVICALAGKLPRAISGPYMRLLRPEPGLVWPRDRPGELASERTDYGQVVLVQRLLDALARLNPALPPEAIDDAFRKLTRPEGPTLEARNRAVHRLLVNGVTVEYRTPDGSIRGAQARAVRL